MEVAEPLAKWSQVIWEQDVSAVAGRTVAFSASGHPNGFGQSVAVYKADGSASSLTPGKTMDVPADATRVRFAVTGNAGSSGTFDCRPQLEVGSKFTAWERPALTTARASSDDPPDDEWPFSE